MDVVVAAMRFDVDACKEGEKKHNILFRCRERIIEQIETDREGSIPVVNC